MKPCYAAAFVWLIELRKFTAVDLLKVLLLFAIGIVLGPAFGYLFLVLSLKALPGQLPYHLKDPNLRGVPTSRWLHRFCEGRNPFHPGQEKLGNSLPIYLGELPTMRTTASW